MIVLPAIDLRGDAVVQLVGGRPERERLRLPDPTAVAERWVNAGFKALHVVDLDAALGIGSSRPAIRTILRSAAVPVQVGGGIRDEDTADAILAEGAARIVVGTRAIEEPAWLEAISARHPGRVVLAADVAGVDVVVGGWRRGGGVAPDALFERVRELPLAAILVTDVDREGRMEGVDVDRFAALAEASAHPLLASGGIASTEDLHSLAGAGAAGAILGMALYTGRLDARAVAREFSDPTDELVAPEGASAPGGEDE